MYRCYAFSFSEFLSFQLTLSRPKGPSTRKKPHRFTTSEATTPQAETTPTHSRHMRSESATNGLSTGTRTLPDGNAVEQSRTDRRKGSKTSSQHKEQTDGVGSNDLQYLTPDRAPMSHPPSSSDSTPSGSPAIARKLPICAEQRRVNFAALAPEHKQAVKKGWPEGSKAKEGKGVESGTSLKEIARKMHGMSAWGLGPSSGRSRISTSRIVQMLVESDGHGVP